jgi:hypothetical protein
MRVPMRHKLLALAAASLLVCGCTSQPNDSANTKPVVDESPDAWPTEPDDPLESIAANADNRELEDPRVGHLKAVAQAFYQYQAHLGHFPPAASTDGNGTPLLSWRVHILPFIGEYDLYKRFHLNESWDSEHNLTLIAEMPSHYQAGGFTVAGNTTLMVFTSENTVFGDHEWRSMAIPLTPFTEETAEERDPPNAQFDGEPTNGLEVGPVPDIQRPGKALAGPTYLDLTDGTANTLLAVYAGVDKAIPWSKPEDLPFDREDPASALGDIADDGILSVFWDSRVESLPKDIDRERLITFIDSTELARKDRETGAKARD